MKIQELVTRCAVARESADAMNAVREVLETFRDDVVDIEGSRAWARGKRHVRLVEVDDTHELGASVDRILAETRTFLAPFLGREHQVRPE